MLVLGSKRPDFGLTSILALLALFAIVIIVNYFIVYRKQVKSYVISVHRCMGNCKRAPLTNTQSNPQFGMELDDLGQRKISSRSHARQEENPVMRMKVAANSSGEECFTASMQNPIDCVICPDATNSPEEKMVQVQVELLSNPAENAVVQPPVERIVKVDRIVEVADSATAREQAVCRDSKEDFFPEDAEAPSYTSSATPRVSLSTTTPTALPQPLGGLTFIKSKDFTIDFEFHDLTLTLKGSEQKQVVQGVTGSLRGGAVHAIMGPSGAGKTSFMTTLAGKAHYGTTTGVVLLNGKPESIRKYKKVVGFVPQEDIMHRTLSVSENLLFYAQLRLDVGVTSEQREELLVELLGVLGLTDVKDSLIGDEETRGISGGQRKRVNIGMELVASPTVLFLDEPTVS